MGNEKFCQEMKQRQLLRGSVLPTPCSPFEFSGEKNGGRGAANTFHLGDPVDDLVEMR
jgi:hypothetical protein